MINIAPSIDIMYYLYTIINCSQSFNLYIINKQYDYLLIFY